MELTCAPPGWRPSRIVLGPGLADAPDAMAALASDVRASLALVDGGVLEPGAAASTPHGGSRAALLPAGLPARILPGGERCKTLQVLEDVLRALAEAGVDRTGTLLVVGGGAVGDLGGLAAALWLRGIRHVQVPTTLLSMVDSSVGGKTAVDLPEGKNLVGAFWPAAEVRIDPGFLRTLPDDEIRSGFGEVLKVAVGLDAELFAAVETRLAGTAPPAPGTLPPAVDPRLDADWAAWTIERCVRAKVDVVERDPEEAGARRLLNLGHTIGHAVEGARRFAVPHGVAVARGMHCAVRLGTELELLGRDDGQRIRALLTACGFAEDDLPPWPDLEPFVRRDKKVAGTTMRAVVPTAVGASRAVEIAPEAWSRTLG